MGAEAETVEITKRGISVPWALVLTLFGIAGGGGVGTFAASAQTDAKLAEQDRRVQRLETSVAVIQNDTDHIKKKQDDTSKQIEKVDNKLDEVLDAVRSDR